jgi:uncharacterized repeat protein (TIGR03803 family)
MVAQKMALAPLSRQVVAAIFCSAFLLAAASAQTFSVLYTFDLGTYPEGTLTLDGAGNLYGTTFAGGDYDYGSVFKLSHSNSAWVLNTLYSFGAGGYTDGRNPAGQVLRDESGVLYGTTHQGGGGLGEGTVFKLAPPPTPPVSAISPWIEVQLYDFGLQGTGGWDPSADLAFDAEGNLYGTTAGGGVYRYGTVYKLTRSPGRWIFSVFYSFDRTQGFQPMSGVTFDATGNLYGTLFAGGANGAGSVYQITPSGSATVLYSFNGSYDGANPQAGVTFDAAGNLYGATSTGGAGGGGVVFELSPSNGTWIYTPIYSLSGSGGPLRSLVFDSAGNLYGTAYRDGANYLGSVFKLTPSNGSWIYSSLHDFAGGSDGEYPIGGPALDENGNLYGTTSQGQNGIFEITPN